MDDGQKKFLMFAAMAFGGALLAPAIAAAAGGTEAAVPAVAAGTTTNALGSGAGIAGELGLANAAAGAGAGLGGGAAIGSSAVAPAAEAAGKLTTMDIIEKAGKALTTSQAARDVLTPKVGGGGTTMMVGGGDAYQPSPIGGGADVTALEMLQRLRGGAGYSPGGGVIY